jgi:hypothetical protein
MWQVGVRSDHVDLNDGDLITPTSIDGVLGGKEDNWTIGVNWYWAATSSSRQLRQGQQQQVQRQRSVHDLRRRRPVDHRVPRAVLLVKHPHAHSATRGFCSAARIPACRTARPANPLRIRSRPCSSIKSPRVASPRPPRAQAGGNVTGAGASFVYPLMSKWTADYKKQTRHAGQLPVDRLRRRHRADQGRDRRLRFLRRADEAGRAGEVRPRPVPVGDRRRGAGGQRAGVAPGKIRFTGPLLADIFQGKVKMWNDRRSSPPTRA